MYPRFIIDIFFALLSAWNVASFPSENKNAFIERIGVPSVLAGECEEAEAIFINSQEKTDVLDDPLVTKCLQAGALDPNFRPDPNSYSIVEASAVKSDEACLTMASRPYGRFFRVPELTVNKDGDTLLMFVLKHNRQECAAWIASRDGDATSQLLMKDRDGRTPLHLAASKNFFRVVEVINSFSGIPLAKDNNGNTPLHSCAFSQQCDLKLIKLLIKYNKDQLLMKNNDGLTPADAAVCYSPRLSIFENICADMQPADFKGTKFMQKCTKCEPDRDFCTDEYRHTVDC